MKPEQIFKKFKTVALFLIYYQNLDGKIMIVILNSTVCFESSFEMPKMRSRRLYT